MDNWTTLTTEIKEYLDKNSEAPFEIKITEITDDGFTVEVWVYIKPGKDLENDGYFGCIPFKRKFTHKFHNGQRLMSQSHHL